MGASPDSAAFFVGQIVDHTSFGYRGVVVAVSARFELTDEWYDQVARSRPPKDKPWYHVLVDGASQMTYVAERHLVPAEDTAQIDHPLLGRFFDRYDGRRYLPREALH